MRKIDDVCACNAWEEIFRTTGEADNLMRENRSADNQLIIIKDYTIEGDRHFLRQYPLRQVVRFLR